MIKPGIANNISLIILPFCFRLISSESIDTFQDPLHQKRMAVIRYVLETLKEDHSSARNIFNDAFDKESGPYHHDKGYDDWLNLYLSQHVDTLSEEYLKKVSIPEKRILTHELYFQKLKDRTETIDYDSIHIMPYANVENPKSLSYGNTVSRYE